MILDIVKARRKGDTIFLTFTPITLPKKKLTRQTRRLRHVYLLAHDSDDTCAPHPILVTQKEEIVMYQNLVTLEWVANVSHQPSHVIYRGVQHELGDI